MSDKTSRASERRRFLKLLGGGAILLPVIGLSACGKEPQSGAAEAAKPKPAPAAKPDLSPPKPATPPAAAGGDLPKLSPDDPQAKALAYVEDATQVDKAGQPRYAAGQACKNCVLYTGGDKPYGGCSIFPGKAVNANGWCSAYAPKPA